MGDAGWFFALAHSAKLGVSGVASIIAPTEKAGFRVVSEIWGAWLSAAGPSFAALW